MPTVRLTLEIGTEASPRGTGVRSAIGGWPTHHVAIPITAADESLQGASIGKADGLMRWECLAASAAIDLWTIAWQRHRVCTQLRADNATALDGT